MAAESVGLKEWLGDRFNDINCRFDNVDESFKKVEKTIDTLWDAREKDQARCDRLHCQITEIHSKIDNDLDALKERQAVRNGLDEAKQRRTNLVWVIAGTLFVGIQVLVLLIQTAR